MRQKADLLARKIAANDPIAVQQNKQAVVASSGVPLSQAYELEDEAKRIVMATQDAREGPQAFMERRAPRFAGR